MFFKSLDDLDKDIINNIHKIPHDIDLVVGVPRSGLLVANIIALYMNLPLTDLEGFLVKRVFESGKTKVLRNNNAETYNLNKVLVVEDSVSSGNSINEAKDKINKIGLKIEFIYLAAYVTPTKTNEVDIYFNICELPRAFEWNIMHHYIVTQSCFDMDGILCIDPDSSENDDGEKYIEFLKNTKPIFIPSQKIGSIVTCRLEKYRIETEEWLKNYGIKYENLIMMHYSSKEERIKNGNYAEYKAYHYLKTDSKLFVESSISQAQVIAKLSQKPVYCLESRRMIYSNSSIAEKQPELSNILDNSGAQYSLDIHERNSSFIGRTSDLKSIDSIKYFFGVLRDYYYIRTSGLFDSTYYLEKNDDVNNSKIDPIMHYIRHGIIERRNPSRKFDTEFYLNNNKDVFRAGMNPLVHYIRFGMKEGRESVGGDDSRSDESAEKKSPINNLESLFNRIIKRKNRIVVYTAITGEYDELKIPKYINTNYDYVCFTDNDEIKSDFWQIRKMDNLELDQVRKARKYKVLPHIYLSEYNYSIWVDGNYQIVGDLEKYIKVFSKRSSMLCIVHPDRDCIYEEAKVCEESKKDSNEIIQKQIQKYASEKYPEHNGLIASGILYRKHKDSRLINVMNEWWKEIVNYSRRDQLSYNYVCWKYNFVYDKCDLSCWGNEYFNYMTHGRNT